MYRSLIGFYFINSTLSFKERTRRANVLPFTLGPYRGNINKVIEAIGPLLSSLNSSIELDIRSEKTFIYAFTIAFISNMP